MIIEYVLFLISVYMPMIACLKNKWFFVNMYDIIVLTYLGGM